MSDDLERRLAERLHAARLPAAPGRLHDLVAALPATPKQRPPGSSRRLPLLLIAAALAGGSLVAALVGVGSRPAVALVSPSPTLAASPANETNAAPVSGPSSSASVSPSSSTPSGPASPIAVPSPPGSAGPTLSASIGRTPTPRAPLTSYAGTLSISAVFGAPYWTGSLAYPVHISIVPAGAGLGHAYTWSMNTQPPTPGGSVASGQPLSTNAVASFSCLRGVYSGSDVGALQVDAAAWFVALQGYGVHDVQTLDIEAGCAAVGHPMASPTPAPSSGGRATPPPPSPLASPVPVTPPPPSSTPVFPTASP